MGKAKEVVDNVMKMLTKKSIEVCDGMLDLSRRVYRKFDDSLTTYFANSLRS